jgi:hypothetical protein
MSKANGRKYIVITAIQYEDLMDLVNDALEAGYICLGGVSVSYSVNGQRVAQAMVLNSAYGA